MKRFMTIIVTISLILPMFIIPAGSLIVNNKDTQIETTEESSLEPQVKEDLAQETIPAETDEKVEVPPKVEEEAPKPQPQPKKKENTSSYRSVTATAYCNWCNDPKGSFATASGATATAGRTIAASSKYSFGTKIEIKGRGVYVVEDRGGKRIQNGAIDIFFYYPDRCHCNDFGIKTVQMRIVG